MLQGSEGDTNETQAAAAPAAAPAMETVKKTRRKTLKLPLKLGGPGFLRPGMNDAQRKVHAIAAAGCFEVLPAQGRQLAGCSTVQLYELGRLLHISRAPLLLSCPSPATLRALQPTASLASGNCTSPT